MHHVPEPAELGIYILSAVSVFQDHNGVAGKRRSVGPDLIREVFVDHKTGISALCKLLKRLSLLEGNASSVKAEHAALIQDAAQVLADRRYAGFPHFHQLHAGSFQLACRLDKIPPVGPQTRLVRGHDQGSRRSRKSAEILSRVKILSRVFGIVKVCCRDHIRGDAFSGHHLAKLFDPFSVDVAHSCLPGGAEAADHG